MQVLWTRYSFYANEERPSFCHVDASTCVGCLSWGLCSRHFDILICKVDLPHFLLRPALQKAHDQHISCSRCKDASSRSSNYTTSALSLQVRVVLLHKINPRTITRYWTK